jgi:hypothetical protein
MWIVDGVRSGRSKVRYPQVCLLCYYCTGWSIRKTQDAATKTQHLILDSRDSPQDDEKAGRPRVGPPALFDSP